MSPHDAKLTSCLADPDSLALALPTADAVTEWGAQPNWPTGWSAWAVNPLGERRAYPNASEAERDRAETIYLVRTSPLRLEFVEPDATTKDDFSCRAVVTLDLRISDTPADLQAFRDRVMRANTHFRTSELLDFLRSSVAPLIRSFIARHSAETLVNAQFDDAFQKHLVDGLAALFFESGIVPAGKPTLRCDSDALERVRTVRRRSAREKQRLALRQEMRAAQHQAREGRLEHLEQQLQRLQQLADADPNLSLADLVRTFSERDRSEIYEALIKLRPPESTTSRVAAASASEVTLIDPLHPHEPAERLPIDGDAGLLRSVQCAQDRDGTALLAIGARKGVYLIAPGDAQPRATFLFPRGDEAFRGGVNSVALADDFLLASHSEVGLIRWKLDDPQRPEFLLADQTRAADTVRHVSRIRDSIWLTIDHRVLRFPIDDLRAEAATSYEGNAIGVTSLFVDDSRVLVGTQTGRILAWDLQDCASPQIIEQGRGRPVESLHLLTGQGLDRIVYSDHSPAATARFLDDAFGCQYQGAGHELRWIVVRDDLLAGVNTTRDRLLLWRPHQPAEPFAVLPLAKWTGHSVQDLCMM